MPIIISKQGKNAKVVTESHFEYEDRLQEYIHENPESIPIYEIHEDKRLFVAKREFATNSGPIDALGIDADGTIYVIETKLWKNQDKRTVVAQALDYGAALWKHFNDFEAFLHILDQETQHVHGQGLREKIADFFELDEERVENTIEGMRRNLKDGIIRFVILMDSIEDRLKDLILYVNQNSQFDIYGVEFKFFKHEEYEIIIPKIFGIEVKKNVGRSSGAEKPKYNGPEGFIAILAQEYIPLFNYVWEVVQKRGYTRGWGSENLSIRMRRTDNKPVTFSYINENGFLSLHLDRSLPASDVQRAAIRKKIDSYGLFKWKKGEVSMKAYITKENTEALKMAFTEICDWVDSLKG